MQVIVDRPTVQRGWRVLSIALHMHARAGDVVHIQAANGRGKSTLLNMLAGLIVPQRGQANIVADGVVVPPSERLAGINYLPHNDCLNPHLRVCDVLHHAAAPLAAAVRANALAQTIHDYALQPLLAYAIKQLSRGQQRRTALAVACLRPKPLRLLDEPTIGLDTAMATRCMQAQQQYANSGGLLIVTSHIPLPGLNTTQQWQF